MTASVPILMYHDVAERPPAATRRLSVSPGLLEQQLEFLVEHGYTGVSFSDLVGAFQTGASLPDKPVVLTFDDGYAGVALDAGPLLRKFDFPATVFVTTGWVDGEPLIGARVPPNQMLSWTQIRALAGSGIEIGAHSHSHPELDQLTDVELCRELGLGRALLEDCIGAPVHALAYPFGYSNPRVQQAARAAGYRCAAVVRNRRATPYDDPFVIPRLTIRRTVDQGTFGAIVTGRPGDVFYRDRLLTAGWACVRRARWAAKRIFTADYQAIAATALSRVARSPQS
ncbi:peptidoglycan/xylan/chitin deacetylase (PgdA/CDA1 family) [Mycobacterium sp. MAA66]|uniref:polysaccharide deacetylase family protein n=1 Tax=Mycobacterium sp. MAA66 TaxID=3156297 RepID=UPI0035196B4B